MANRVLISVDCVCDLPRKMWEDLELSVMYFYVKTEEGRFQDIIEVNAENIVEYLAQGKKAHSSSASMEEYRGYFERIRKNHDGPIIHICIARYLSESFEAASKAAGYLENVYVVDSAQLSGGMSLLVLVAAEMAKAGADYELILKEVEMLREKVCTSFVVNSTEHLYINGQISRRVATLCETFSLHPILQLKDSRMGASGICIGNQTRYAKTYIKRMLKNPETIDTNVAFLVSAGCSYEYVNFLKEEIQKIVKFKRLIINTASATITCNCGAGTFGVLFARK